MNSTSTTFPIGDDWKNRQYRSILSFNTAKLPAKAYLDYAMLYLHGNGAIGSNPLAYNSGFGELIVDVKKGAFGGNKVLQLYDFLAPETSSSLSNPVCSYPRAKCSIYITETGAIKINPSGITQLRLRLKSIPGQLDNSPDNFQAFSGDAGALTNRPTLVVYYYP